MKEKPRKIPRKECQDDPLIDGVKPSSSLVTQCEAAVAQLRRSAVFLLLLVLPNFSHLWDWKVKYAQPFSITSELFQIYQQNINKLFWEAQIFFCRNTNVIRASLWFWPLFCLSVSPQAETTERLKSRKVLIFILLCISYYFVCTR